MNVVQVPDREIAQLEEDCAKKGLPVKVGEGSRWFLSNLWQSVINRCALGQKRRAIQRVSKQRRQRQILRDERGDCHYQGLD